MSVEDKFTEKLIYTESSPVIVAHHDAQKTLSSELSNLCLLSAASDTEIHGGLEQLPYSSEDFQNGMPPAAFKGLYVHHQKREVRVIYYSYERRDCKPVRRQCSFSFNAYGFDGANVRAQNLISYIKKNGTLPREYANPSRRTTQKPRKAKVNGAVRAPKRPDALDGADWRIGCTAFVAPPKKRGPKPKNPSRLSTESDYDQYEHSLLSSIYNGMHDGFYGIGAEFDAEQLLFNELSRKRSPHAFDQAEASTSNRQIFLKVVHKLLPHSEGICVKIFDHLDADSLGSMEQTSPKIRRLIMESDLWKQELMISGFDLTITQLGLLRSSKDKLLHTDIYKAQLVACCGGLNRMWARMACQELILNLGYQEHIAEHTHNEEDWEFNTYKQLAHDALDSVVQYDAQAERCKLSLRAVQLRNEMHKPFDTLLAAPWSTASIISKEDLIKCLNTRSQDPLLVEKLHSFCRVIIEREGMCSAEADNDYNTTQNMTGHHVPDNAMAGDVKIHHHPAFNRVAPCHSDFASKHMYLFEPEADRTHFGSAADSLDDFIRHIASLPDDCGGTDDSSTHHKISDFLMKYEREPLAN
eukprot:GHVN01002075.1.p1 GENE.GHVN01002075.1~~GHVN01002075.1.p1  ORF type:complete len:583 (+),score=60.50 GHVN01002075.1:294-2042(+)